jgi:CheY-like chemotaxis protein
LSGVKVLLIDDELDTRTLLRAVLEECNADVRDVGTAEGGLQMARDWDPSIVVSDIGMPGDDGYDFIRKFRESQAERSSRTPAVALTAYARAEDRVRALTAALPGTRRKTVDPSNSSLSLHGQITAALVQGEMARGKHSLSSSASAQTREMVQREPRRVVPWGIALFTTMLPPWARRPHHFLNLLTPSASSTVMAQ